MIREKGVLAGLNRVKASGVIKAICPSAGWVLHHRREPSKKHLQQDQSPGLSNVAFKSDATAVVSQLQSASCDCCAVMERI